VSLVPFVSFCDSLQQYDLNQQPLAAEPLAARTSAAAGLRGFAAIAAAMVVGAAAVAF